MPETYDFIIIGGGVASMAAAMYAGRMNLKTLVLAETLGGTIILTDTVENYPGFKKIKGLELADKLKEHALEYGIKIIQVTYIGRQVDAVSPGKGRGIFQISPDRQGARRHIMF